MSCPPCPPVPVFISIPWFSRGCPCPTLTDIQIATLKANIAQLELAMINMMSGLQVSVSVDQNGERLEFRGAALTDLKAYIQQLKAQLPGYDPTCGVGAVARPMRWLF